MTIVHPQKLLAESVARRTAPQTTPPTAPPTAPHTAPSRTFEATETARQPVAAPEVDRRRPAVAPFVRRCRDAWRNLLGSLERERIQQSPRRVVIVAVKNSGKTVWSHLALPNSTERGDDPRVDVAYDKAHDPLIESIRRDWDGGRPIPSTPLSDGKTLTARVTLDRPWMVKAGIEGPGRYLIELRDVAGGLIELDNMVEDNPVYQQFRTKLIDDMRAADLIVMLVDPVADESQRQEEALRRLTAALCDADGAGANFPPIAVCVNKFDTLVASSGSLRGDQAYDDESLQLAEETLAGHVAAQPSLVKLVFALRRLVRREDLVQLIPMASIISSSESGASAVDGELVCWNVAAPLLWGLPRTDRHLAERANGELRSLGLVESSGLSVGAGAVSAASDLRLRQGRETLESCLAKFDREDSVHQACQTSRRVIRSEQWRRSVRRTAATAAALFVATAAFLLVDESRAYSRYRTVVDRSEIGWREYHDAVGAYRRWYNPLRSWLGREQFVLRDEVRLKETFLQQAAVQYRRMSAEMAGDGHAAARNGWIDGQREVLKDAELLRHEYDQNILGIERFAVVERHRSIQSRLREVLKVVGTCDVSMISMALDESAEVLSKHAESDESRPTAALREQLTTAFAARRFDEAVRAACAMPEERLQDFPPKLARLESLLRDATEQARPEIARQLALCSNRHFQAEDLHIKKLVSNRQFAEASSLLEGLRSEPRWQSAIDSRIQRVETAWDKYCWEPVEIAAQQRQTPDSLRAVANALKTYLDGPGPDSRVMRTAAVEWLAAWDRRGEPQEITVELRSITVPEGSPVASFGQQAPKLTLVVDGDAKTNPKADPINRVSLGQPFTARHTYGSFKVKNIRDTKVTVRLTCYRDFFAEKPPLTDEIVLEDINQPFFIKNHPGHLIELYCPQVHMPDLPSFPTQKE